MKKADVVIVIPAHNEEKYVGDVLKSVTKMGYSSILVDDGSTDSTQTISRNNARYYLRHKVNLGKGAALKTGCDFAFKKLGAKAVIFLDSDGQHDANELHIFFSELNKGNAVVFGARSLSSEMPFIKTIGNRLASIAVLLIYGKYIADIPSGYKAMTHHGYSLVEWRSPDYRVELEIAVNVIKRKAQYSIVPIKTIYNDYSKGLHLIDGIEQLISFIAWRFTK